jgi:hypothetical protein
MTVRNGEGIPEGYQLGAVAGRAFERERIIALLEEPDFGGFLLWWAGTKPTAEDTQDAVASIVARIEGEKNE